jgi:hypothetical protein
LALVAGATTWDGIPEITKVVPSGSEWATAAEPTMPLAPGRFSTTTLCANALPRCSARMRPIVSALPPGGHGTTTRMGLLGQVCGEGGVDGCASAGASAEPVSAPMIAAAANSRCTLASLNCTTCSGRLPELI